MDCCGSSWRTLRLSCFRFTCFMPGAWRCPQRRGFSLISQPTASGGGSVRFEQDGGPCSRLGTPANSELVASSAAEVVRFLAAYPTSRHPPGTLDLGSQAL